MRTRVIAADLDGSIWVFSVRDKRDCKVGAGGNRSQIQNLIDDLDEDDEGLFSVPGYLEFISPLKKSTLCDLKSYFLATCKIHIWLSSCSG